MTDEEARQLRDQFYIICEGRDLPPPITSFNEMRLPPAVLRQLEEKGIKKPTPIQVLAVISITHFHPPSLSTF
jgi:ATP-dependent RNA helicase DDX41